VVTKKILKILAIPVFLIGAAETYQLTTESTSFTSSFAHVLFSNNLHEIVPSEIYRSSEMPVSTFVSETQRLGIKTVLDVRLGPDKLSKEYLGEAEALNAVGINYIHFPLKGSREMTQEQVADLLKLLNSAENPLLVHCSSGTHRSGVVTAIYLMDVKGLPYHEAIQQMSGKYGFFRFEREIKSAVSGRPTIDNILWRYGEFLEKHPNVKFREWVDAGMS